jgi:protease I
MLMDLQGKKVAILVADDFERVEMVEPRKALEEAGAQTMIISPADGQVQSMNHDEKADKFNVDVLLNQANPDDFDALLLPGGALNPDQLRANSKAKEFVRAFDVKDKPIAAICHGAWTLVSAGLVSGRTLTSWPSIQDDIRNAGGHWIDEKSVRDQNWVSSRSPMDIPAFNEAMIELFSEWEQVRQQKLKAA